MAKDLIETLLALEKPAKDAALNLEPSDNCDAIKSALCSVSSGIGHLRKALDQVRRWER